MRLMKNSFVLLVMIISFITTFYEKGGILMSQAKEKNQSIVEAPEGYFSITEALTKDSDFRDGYYYKTYTVEGVKDGFAFIDIDSADFIPALKLYYGDAFIVEAQDVSEIYHKTTRWMGSIEQKLDQKGTYKIVVTTKEKGATGEFLLRYLFKN